MKLIFKLPIFSLLPRRCAYCGKAITADSLMCDGCAEKVSRIEGETCKHCGREKKICSCKKSSNYYTAIAAPFYFEGVVRKGMHSFKFRNCPRNSEAFSDEMSKTIKEKFADVSFDYITEVPMTKKKVRKRGYNQCALLSKNISELTGIEYREGILTKLYETGNQHGLTYYLRKGNLTGAFDVVNPEEVKDKTILLCDDVSTSGETFNECAKMLWLYGAGDVYCIATALTKPVKKK